MTSRDPEFELETTAEDGRLVVRAVGELDMATAPQLDAALEGRHAEHEAALVDLSQARFVDSSGLRTLLEQRERWTAQGRGFSLVSPPEQVRRVFALAGLDELFDWAEG